MPLEMLKLVYLLNVMTDVYGANSCAIWLSSTFRTEDLNIKGATVKIQLSTRLDDRDVCVPVLWK